MDDSLLALLDQLVAEPPAAAQNWQAWQIRPITGGANNLLYRATRAPFDYAIKFTVRDDRNRAQREYAALCALQEAGLTVAPRAVWSDRQRYPQPVVVQTWLDGATLSAPPQTAAEWDALINHYCTIHTLTPTHTTVDLAEATLNVASGAAGKALIQQHLDRLPITTRPVSLQTILAWFALWRPPTWAPPRRALCRVDANWRNFIRRDEGWASVDWENSGWGDPAFELADLMTHPAYDAMPATHWAALTQTYAERTADSTAILRVTTYYTMMLVWWAVRWARYLYEVPRGLDARLVERPANWQQETEQKYAQHMARLVAHIAVNHGEFL
ncbi:MAG: aminoglycoside phosphotransferase family protein [Chloroflexi bacterium]|nr:aminoglycoside phosphotransferase family protein [Chloroflexota bacterium]